MFQDRRTLLPGLLILLAIATLAPGLITRRANGIICFVQQAGCWDTGANSNPLSVNFKDGRVPGTSGDLIALYCQRDYRKIDVYGITNGAGTYLTSFAVDELVGAGPRGVKVDLGEIGTATMTILPSKDFYIVLEGKMITALNLDSYAKIFPCSF